LSSPEGRSVNDGIDLTVCSLNFISVDTVTEAGTSHFKPHYFIRLNAECRADIEWWYIFHRSWHGVAIIRNLDAITPDVVLCTDASGSWGCGAFWRTLWFQVPWDGLAIAVQSIAGKELFSIVLASLLWGRIWQRLTVLCRCDNGAVVEVVNRQSARDPPAVSFLRQCEVRL
jgi:hypothetical protein